MLARHDQPQALSGDCFAVHPIGKLYRLAGEFRREFCQAEYGDPAIGASAGLAGSTAPASTSTSHSSGPVQERSVCSTPACCVMGFNAAICSSDKVRGGWPAHRTCSPDCACESVAARSGDANANTVAKANGIARNTSVSGRTGAL
jgi:hypothetical protein